ncbi:MAG: hypothetical protein SFX73_14475 [Kofleriaceae bacterium]|nr:hypothetical protein [Kofleriaceae bacterium]
MRDRAIRALVLICLTACGDKNGDSYCDGGACGPDAPTDARLTCSDPGGPPCATGEICIGGTCVINTCETSNPCAEGDACNMVCIPLEDKCKGVTCGENTTCVDGQCVPGCFGPSPCLDKDCADGEFCQFGACIPIVPCDLECGTGYTCHVTCRAPSPCDNVVCQQNEFCYQGQCIVNPCHGVTCAPGEVCNGGTCVTTCDCEGGCGANGECVLDECQCVPDCAGKACGDDNGCGGQCDVACPQGGQYDCRPMGSNGPLTCQCVGSCTGKACGEDDGCGNECNGTCASPNTCVLQGAGNYECECIPTCPNPSGQQCGQANTCGTGFCDIEDCADSGETCNPTSGGMYACQCPTGRAECNGDCCGAATDACRTGIQTGTGTMGAVTGTEACCNQADQCTDASRNTVCCTGSGLSCLDSDNDGDTESCCTAARQCGDTTAPATNSACCAATETCMDTTADGDTQKDTCCTTAQACTEIGTCCGSGTYCSTRPGNNNDLCCATGTMNCDGACVPLCNGVAPNRCNDGVAGNEVCCTGNKGYCDGVCVDKCPTGQTQYQCGDGTQNNEVCCNSNVDRCVGATNTLGSPAYCCDALNTECYTQPSESPICCSDETSLCNDSGACCPPDEACLSDNDNNDNNDVCCAGGQVLDGSGSCCTPICPPEGSIACGQLDSCGYQECKGTCNAASTCIEDPASGPPNWSCEPIACDPLCNTAACFDCVAGTCDYRCDNPGFAGSCVAGQCVIQ